MARKPVRIMYLDTAVDMSGGQYGLFILLKHLDRSNYVPLVYAPGRSRLKQACEQIGIETHGLPFRSAYKAARPFLGVFAWLADVLGSLVGILFLAGEMGRKRVDVVHANNFKAALVASMACLLTRKPLVYHDRTTMRRRITGRIVTGAAKRIIAVSSPVAEAYGETLRGKVRLIYDGVDTEYLSPEKVVVDRTTRTEARVCYLGRISWEKGLDNLVRAAGIVTAKAPGTSFLIGGSPFTHDDVEYERDLLKLVDSLGLAGSVVFMGQIDDVRAFMMAADVVVVPSRRDALGFSLLEAMALERPVVAFAADGPREIITDRKDGLLVQPDDVDKLAEAILTMLRDRDFARRAGRMGRETVISRFSLMTFISRVCEIYDDLAGGQPV
jgi:glycosyltransferase involved in cell wall biosynthesis